MNPIDPRTPEEWELFRFPPRRVPSIRASEEEQDESGDEDEGEGDGDGDGDGGALIFADEPEVCLRPWVYSPDDHALKNHSLHKKIELSHLGEAQAIVRLLAVLELRPEFEPASLMQALETASQACYGMDLAMVLADHGDGQPLVWGQARAVVASARPSI